MAAASLLGGLAIHVELSATATVDVPATFFALAACWASVAFLEDGRPSRLIAALVACGLAASTKYNAGACLIAPALALGYRSAGMDPVRAGEFSFLMAIPVIAGAAILEIPKLAANATLVGSGPLVASFLVSMISGVLAIRWLLVLLRKGTFYRFAPYCWILGVATILWGVLAG